MNTFVIENTVRKTQIIPDGLYYIALVDLVGSTKFATKHGNAALSSRICTFVKASKTALEHARMSRNSGRFVKSVGDGVLIVFSHFPDVVQWHIEFEAVISATTPCLEPLQARTCIHAGELRFDVGDTLNLATNQVSKMEKKVGAGHLVLSDIAYRLALPSLYSKQCEFEKYGTVLVDGHACPVTLYRLVVKAEMAFLIDKTARGRG